MELCQKLLQETFSYEDGNLIWKQPTGRRISVGQIAGRSNNAYKAIGFMGKEYMAHRLVFMFHHGYLPPEVDHIAAESAASYATALGVSLMFLVLQF